ncbi:MAG: triose-phosphate isomerase [Bacteroidales bacterium]|nr:triose-phosphate isomerase [Bacteroidales bacterium]MCF8337626.1 triose-phosphate isomerase [Bacteroidales bacterium]
MRKKIIAGNWKMNKTFEEANGLINEVAKGIANKEFFNKEVVLCPPFLYTEMAADFADDYNFSVGVQDISQYPMGAYTGEIAAEMARSVGVQYSIIGHSERRSYFNETDDILSRKVDMALENELTPIFCCGEHLDVRKADKQFKVVGEQLTEGLFYLDKKDITRVVVAYEPVWAIGTGETASPLQAQEMHEFIRNQLAGKYGEDVAAEIPILYGGSVKPSNAHDLFIQPDIDGGLIGGGSLKSQDFLQIIEAMKDE